MIEVQRLRRYYGAHLAVDDISFSIQSNAIVGFLGLNGAGKSTVLKVLAGLLLPSSGSVRIDGEDISVAPVAFRQHIGFQPEEPPLYPEMTVEEYLRFLGQLRGMSSADLDGRVREVATITQLTEQLQRVIGELSHGYRKRVGIAQAIIHRPNLVILDEPISGLDPVQIVDMRKVIRQLAEQSTVLISSHNLPEISQVCDRILVLVGGHLVADGTEAELAARLNTGRTVLMTVTGERDRLAGLLTSHPEVASFSVEAEHEGRVQVRIEMQSDAREALVASIVGAGLGVRRLEETRDDLEEIFIDLTREGAA